MLIEPKEKNGFCFAKNDKIWLATKIDKIKLLDVIKCLKKWNYF